MQLAFDVYRGQYCKIVSPRALGLYQLSPIAYPLQQRVQVQRYYHQFAVLDARPAPERTSLLNC
jgi:hypothetical protein